jgi:hypothetical protein
MSRIAISIILMLGLSSCSSTIPSGFWTDFQKNFLKENIRDMGPYGGHRAMHWKAEKQRAFNSKEVIDFATKNGWQLVDSLEVQADDLKTWYYNNAPIFPLSHTGFSATPSNNSTYKNFPRWIKSALKVYTFETGWVTIEPGTDDSIEENGFVVLENEGSEMSVYHLWGE